jgi:ABC-2 type transport system permease protein
MKTVVGNEALKTFLKWRSYIGFIAIAVVVPLVEIALKLEGGSMVRAMTRNLARDFLLLGNLFNAYFVTMFIMNGLWVHIPFLISLVAGDQLAGEGTGGTFRLLLTRPPSRSYILFCKYLVTLLYTTLLVVFLAVLAIGLGIFLFGTGDLLVPGKGLTVIAASEVPWRYCVAFLLAIWSMWCVATLAFLFSSLVENSIGPIIGSMAVIIVFIVISNIPVSLFATIKPFLFTTYFNVWQHAMEQPVPWGKIWSSVASLGAFSVSFYLATWYYFVKKDILS